MVAPAGSTPHWFTPLQWWLELEHDFLRWGLIRKRFDFDPCGHPEAPVSQEILRRGGRVLTAREDGLKAWWPGSRTVWLNPPYDSESMEAWAPLARDYGANYRGELAGLVPAWTDRAWWHGCIEPYRRTGHLEVRFIPGRLRFGWPGNPHGVGADSARFPSALFVWSADVCKPRNTHPRRA